MSVVGLYLVESNSGSTEYVLLTILVLVLSFRRLSLYKRKWLCSAELPELSQFMLL